MAIRWSETFRDSAWSALSPAICAWLLAFIALEKKVQKSALFIPYLLIIVLLGMAVARFLILWKRQKRSETTILSIPVVAATGFFLWFWPPLYDGTKFVVWAPLHPQVIVSSRGADAVIQHWDAWGFATMDNDSFLVADKSNWLSTQTGALQWQKRNGGACTILAATRMMPGIFIAITDGCTPGQANLAQL